MAKVYKPGKPPHKSNRPRITWLHVIYLAVAFSMVVSLLAGVFGGSALTANQTAPITSQSVTLP
ncbi:MAG: hypothetical protein Q7O66_19490 [Dehalococcoidia bacterium]|nr:hypothetical protein [Dehalococcoidia bacterium]